MNYIKIKILKWLFKSDPELCAEVFCEDFVGIVPRRSVDLNSLRFLAKNAAQMEPWILHMNHQLQREQTLWGKKLRNPGFYEGAMFILRLLYTKVVRYVPKKTTEPTIVKTISDPIEGVEAFENGLKDIIHGKESDAESETSQI